MSKVVGLVTKTDIVKEQYKKDLLEIVDLFREMVENDEIREFVIASLDQDGEVVLTTCCKDLIGGVGLFEFGKQALMQQT
jgi:hypothetical protein